MAEVIIAVHIAGDGRVPRDAVWQNVDNVGIVLFKGVRAGMEKHRRTEGRGHGTERAHCGQCRLFVSGQHSGQTPSGQSVQRKEDQTAEQAQRNRRLVSTARHGGGRDTGGDHGHGRFHQQEEQAHPSVRSAISQTIQAAAKQSSAPRLPVSSRLTALMPASRDAAKRR